MTTAYQTRRFLPNFQSPGEPGMTVPALSDEAMRQYYAKLSHELALRPWRIHGVPERQEEFDVVRTKALQFASDLELFEIACGVGYWTGQLCRFAASIYAVDVCDEAIAVAKRRVTAKNVQFSVEDAFGLCFPDREVSGLFAGFWLSDVRRHQLAFCFQHLSNCVPSGTRAMFVDNGHATGLSRRFAGVDSVGDTYEQRRLGDGSTHTVLKNYVSDDELAAAVQGVATDLRIERGRYYWVMRFATRKPND